MRLTVFNLLKMLKVLEDLGVLENSGDLVDFQDLVDHVQTRLLAAGCSFKQKVLLV